MKHFIEICVRKKQIVDNNMSICKQKYGQQKLFSCGIIKNKV